MKIKKKKRETQRKKEELFYDYCKILFHSMDLEITECVLDLRLVNGSGASL